MKSLRILAWGLCVSLLLFFGSAQADELWEPDLFEPLQRGAVTAIEKVKVRHPETQHYFDEAYAYAVYPSAVRAGMFMAGGYGKGVVIEQGRFAATTKLWQFTYAVFAGGQVYSQFLFFKTKEAFDAFASGELHFTGQAAVAFLHLGAAADPSYSPDVALVTQTRFGLEVELTPGTVYFSYLPLEQVDNDSGTGDGSGTE